MYRDMKGQRKQRKVFSKQKVLKIHFFFFLKIDQSRKPKEIFLIKLFLRLTKYNEMIHLIFFLLSFVLLVCAFFFHIIIVIIIIMMKKVLSHPFLLSLHYISLHLFFTSNNAGFNSSSIHTLYPNDDGLAWWLRWFVEWRWNR